MRILQNQDHFYTEVYKTYVTPLVKGLESSCLRPLKGFRHNWLAAGIMMYLLRKEYDIVVTAGHREALSFGAICRLLPGKKPIHVAKEIYFEFDGSGGSLRQRFLRCVYRFALKKVDMMVVNSSGEIAPYARLFALPESRFRFIPLPSNMNEHQEFGDSNGSILAIGYSLRDWDTFFKAVDGLPWQSVVIASRKDVQKLTVPANVALPFNVPRVEYLRHLKSASIVVIPLLETIRSTGQTAFLEAMSHGKPVIVADVVGARDYITEGQNGLLYCPGNPEDLRKKITRLMCNDALRKAVAESGLESVATQFNKENYARTFRACCNEIVVHKGLVKSPLRSTS